MREMWEMQAFNIQEGQHDYFLVYLFRGNFICDVKSTQEVHSGIWQYIYLITVRYF